VEMAITSLLTCRLARGIDVFDAQVIEVSVEGLSLARSREALAKQVLLPPEAVIGLGVVSNNFIPFLDCFELHFTSSVLPCNLPTRRDRVDHDVLQTAQISIEYGRTSGEHPSQISKARSPGPLNLDPTVMHHRCPS
jgi:hypothetical protein